MIAICLVLSKGRQKIREKNEEKMSLNMPA